MRFPLLVAGLIGLTMVTACTQPLPEGVSVIEVSDAYVVKPAEGRDVTGGGMMITVRGADEALVAATADFADSVEIHTMSMDGGMMKMRKLDSLPITEKEPLVLERGGNHLMFFGVSSDIAIGDSVDIVLTFDNGQGKEQMLVTTAEIIGQGD
ncbi:copper chaperone PCu(A)C [Hyphomonas sp.]|uniref:copper chaperone PCu(A)C n=1 Tax=Hyphomonas sp. TaxID=87 RepID=UPI003F72D5FE